MYQHMRLYESSGSQKLLLTAFVLSICAAGILGLAGLYYACKGGDGRPGISFQDIQTFVQGARRSVLERAVSRPDEYGLKAVPRAQLQKLRDWCRKGAPRDEFPAMWEILKDSDYVRSRGAAAGPATGVSEEDINREYDRICALARRPKPLSDTELSVGIALYLSLTAFALLGLGMLFVRTSMFEKRKTFFVGSAFILIAACPICLWLARQHTSCVYLFLLSMLLLVVCFGVFALVALFDIWFRRPVT